jgi:hypothetical protein
MLAGFAVLLLAALVSITPGILAAYLWKRIRPGGLTRTDWLVIGWGSLVQLGVLMAIAVSTLLLSPASGPPNRRRLKGSFASGRIEKARRYLIRS